MAEIAVGFVLSYLRTLVTVTEELSIGISIQASKISDELENMRAFLLDADTKAESNQVVKQWVKEVREAAYDTEDALDEFMLFMAQASDQEGDVFHCCTICHGNFFKRWMMSLRIGGQIQKIRFHIADISARRQRYSLLRVEQDDQGSNTLPARVNILRMSSRFIDEDDLVGIDDSSHVVIQWLVEGEPRLTTIAVIGMGGLGKTTLAGKVYNSREVKEHFECCAWVTVSQSFSITEIFRRLVREFIGSSVQGVEKMETSELIKMLMKFLLEKRYVIVFDDIWKKIDWDLVKPGLPNGKTGSRILVTTRVGEVADALDRIYRLQPLPEEAAFELFCRKAFHPEFQGSCPPNLADVSKKMVKKCEGLPLAIVAIGGLLKSKPKRPVVWWNLYGCLEYEIEKNDTLTTMKHILLLSFNGLPYPLKSCFSYVSIFPEDYPIKRKRLINLWVAEGFMEAVQGRAMEDVADDYLNELIDRSLIQVVRYSDYGTIIACRVHDLLREIVLSKCRKENFVTSVVDGNMDSSVKARRLSIYRSAPKVLKMESLHQLRSFLIFDVDDISPTFINAVFPGFKVLKVLDLEGLPIKIFPSEIVDLLLLKLLSLRNTKIGNLPPSIGNLKILETLDIRGTKINELPPNVLKLKRLRHLLARTDDKISVNLVMPPSGLGNLESLLTLAYVAIDQASSNIALLQQLVQLRRLGIDNVRREDGTDLCNSIQQMPLLSVLSVSAREEEELNLHSLPSPPQFLQQLHLRGRLESLPNWILSLSSLVCLRLESSKLKEDPFTALQDLMNLMELELSLAYDGEELCCVAKGFPRLQFLHLSQLYKLKKVTLEEGAMPSLQKLWLHHCSSLQRVPFGIEHLNLKELRSTAAGDELKRSTASDGGEDHWKIKYIPVISLK